MAAKNSAATEATERELLITRIFHAPRSLVWRAWAEPERMACWAGPKGFTITSCEMGSRPGDIFRMSMRSPEGTEHHVRESITRSWRESASFIPGHGWTRMGIPATKR
jgi:uncharacterized protein YndB with AHSA1/START domain